MFKHVVAVCAAILTAGAASLAFAAPAEMTVSQGVSTAGVDFQDRQAVDRFYARLKRSASYVCDSRSADRSISRLDRDCYRQAMDRAVRTLAHPTLTARYENDRGSASSGFAVQGY